MLRLEDVDDKREVFQIFFEWLFDDNRIINKSICLNSEVDFSLCSHYLDSNIYYPNQIKCFFETNAMDRLNRISQLGLAINAYPHLYHNRLEHSKGVYNKKLEEFFYKFQDINWKKYIEDNNLKLYLIADLIKMAGHDIGHLPLSHALEEQISSYRGFHEEIGKRIMLENAEIQNVLSNISPELNLALNELYTKDILNFKTHDESNYDVDRLDYLSRDSLYLGFSIHLPIQNYQTVCIETDDDNFPKFNSDYSISESSNGNYFIDVYDFLSLHEIEEALELRSQQYQNVYMSPDIQVYENSIKNFFKPFLSSNSDIGKNLKTFLLHLYNSDVNDLNLDEFIGWDEIEFYSELLEIAENHDNLNIRNLATMIIPNLDSLLTLIYSFLNINNKTTYSDSHKCFLKKIKTLINSNSTLSKNLRNKAYFLDNIIFLPKDSPFLDSSEKDLVNYYSYKVKPYKDSEPIYVRNKLGKIFELSHHPDSTYVKNAQPLYLESSFVNIPFLKFHGIDDTKINKLKKIYPNNINSLDKNKKSTVNMYPLRVKHNIQDVFLEL